MSPTRKSTVEPYHAETGTTPEPDGFDVTCIIGRVVFGGGEMTEHEAAFNLIAKHNAPGSYIFPLPNGGDCVVTVEFKDPPELKPVFGESRPHDDQYA